MTVLLTTHIVWMQTNPLFERHSKAILVKVQKTMQLFGFEAVGHGGGGPEYSDDYDFEGPLIKFDAVVKATEALLRRAKKAKLIKAFSFSNAIYKDTRGGHNSDHMIL